MSQVQAILVSRFGQQIHVAETPPPPTPRPMAPWPTWYVVAGAGSDTWNGNYTLAHQQQQQQSSEWAAAGERPPPPGTPTYVQKTNASRSIYRARGAWRLAVRAVAVAYVAGGSTAASALPPSTGWQTVADDGLAVPPAPTLTEGPL